MKGQILLLENIYRGKARFLKSGNFTNYSCKGYKSEVAYLFQKLYGKNGRDEFIILRERYIMNQYLL